MIFFAVTVQSATRFVCEDEGINTPMGDFDVRVELFKVNNYFEGQITLTRDGLFFKRLKQSKLEIWRTYGAEVFFANGEYFEVFEDGSTMSVSGSRFTVSRMLATEQGNLVSIVVDSEALGGRVDFISRRCRIYPIL